MTTADEPARPFVRAEMPYDEDMSKRERITRELDHIPEQDLDRLLEFLGSLKQARADTAVSTMAAESSLSKDWLTDEEDAAWANL